VPQIYGDIGGHFGLKIKQEREKKTETGYGVVHDTYTPNQITEGNDNNNNGNSSGDINSQNEIIEDFRFPKCQTWFEIALTDSFTPYWGNSIAHKSIVFTVSLGWANNFSWPLLDVFHIDTNERRFFKSDQEKVEIKG
jgi:hypothetical protein